MVYVIYVVNLGQCIHVVYVAELFVVVVLIVIIGYAIVVKQESVNTNFLNKIFYNYLSISDKIKKKGINRAFRI